MVSENREIPVEEVEDKDRTKLVWLGLIALVALMLLALWMFSSINPPASVVRARHVLIEIPPGDPSGKTRAYELAQELRQRIAEGEASFADIAQEYSQDPYSAGRGGDLGYSERGDYVEEFEEYVWTAPIGELSEVIETSLGYHIIRVDDRIISEVERARKEEEERLKEIEIPGQETQE